MDIIGRSYTLITSGNERLRAGIIGILRVSGNLKGLCQRQQNTLFLTEAVISNNYNSIFFLQLQYAFVKDCLTYDTSHGNVRTTENTFELQLCNSVVIIFYLDVFTACH